MAAMPSTPHPMAAAFEKAVADKMNMRGGSKQSGAATYPKLGHKNPGAGGVGGGKTPPGWTKGNKTGWGGKAAPPGRVMSDFPANSRLMRPTPQAEVRMRNVRSSGGGAH